jgi:hypothetical protein
MLGNLLGGFIVILVGVNLIGPVADSVKSALYHNNNISLPTNVTGASATIMSLVILFFALAIVSAGIAIAAIGLKQTGLLGM